MNIIGYGGMHEEKIYKIRQIKYLCTFFSVTFPPDPIGDKPFPDFCFSFEWNLRIFY